MVQGWVEAEHGGFVWGTLDYRQFATVGLRFAGKAKSGEKDDLLDSIIEALAKVSLRKIAQGQPFSEPAMYRTAEHVKDAYWYRHYAYYNGLDCRNCTAEQRAKCRWNWAHSDWQYCDCHRAIELESLNQPAVDDDGFVTELAELIADDNALDLAAWQDAKTFLIGAPIRLKAIARKRLKGDSLTVAERKYLTKLRQREQLSLAKG